jgi:hypothetical protein
MSFIMLGIFYLPFPTLTSFGGIYVNQWFQGDFPCELSNEQTSMAFYELYPIVMACVLCLLMAAILDGGRGQRTQI